MSLTLQILIEDVKDNIPNWKRTPKQDIKKYLKKKFKCSNYFANETVEWMFAGVTIPICEKCGSEEVTQHPENNDEMCEYCGNIQSLTLLEDE